LYRLFGLGVDHHQAMRVEISVLRDHHFAIWTRRQVQNQVFGVNRLTAGSEKPP
jgi:heme/copper-type cytochrome/quinol oxidase subunit 2